MEFDRSIQLSKDSYVKIYNSSQSIVEYIENNFDKIFDLHPEYDNNEKSKIMHKSIQNNSWYEVETKRWFKSYLNVPPLNKEYSKSSYMFSGKCNHELDFELPDEVKPLYDEACKVDKRFNQVVINWYEGKDLIPLHTDWTDNMVDNYSIGVLSMYGKKDQIRDFIIYNRITKETHTIEFKNGMFILMCGKFQDEFQHSVPSAKDKVSRRIGISFRSYK